VDIDFTAGGEIGHALTESELQNFKGRLYASPQGEYWWVDTHYVELDPSPSTPTAAVMSSCTRSSPDGTRYSGTGCTIAGHWTAGDGRHLSVVQLWVNGCCRFAKPWSGSTGPNEYSAVVPFSSTQFPHNSTMTLKAECWNDNADYDSGEQSKTAWNSAYVLVNGTMLPAEPGQQIAGPWAISALQDMNHETSPTAAVHSAQVILGNIPTYGVFYIYSHSVGDDGHGFYDCLWYPDLGGDPDYAVLTWQAAAAVGVEDEGQCPYVFVFLDTCYNGQSDAWLTAFGASAMVGWVGESQNTVYYGEWTKYFWEYLASEPLVGHTVQQALDHANYMRPNTVNYHCWGNSGLCLHKEYSYFPDP
jgi:hypothetical protein